MFSILVYWIYTYRQRERLFMFTPKFWRLALTLNTCTCVEILKRTQASVGMFFLLAKKNVNFVFI